MKSEVKIKISCFLKSPFLLLAVFLLDSDCDDGATCQTGQEDFNTNGIGDACECYGDCDDDCADGAF